jgi:hypothetical protein
LLFISKQTMQEQDMRPGSGLVVAQHPAIEGHLASGDGTTAAERVGADLTGQSDEQQEGQQKAKDNFHGSGFLRL